MKSVNTIKEQVSSNRAQWFEYRRNLEMNLSTLETLYAAQYDENSPLYHSTPAQTVAAFVEAVGYEAAVEIVASLVNRSAWDGRISRRSIEWANTQENSWDEEACSSLSLYTNRIHMAHLDQIAAAMMKYEPVTEPAAEEIQEAAEEASGVPATVPASVKFTVYVGLNDRESKHQEVSTLDAFKIASNLFRAYTGGATISEARGVYTHDDGTIITENTLRCEVFGATVQQIETVAAELKRAFNQESIAIEQAVVNTRFF